MKTKIQIVEALLQDLLKIKRLGLKDAGICNYVYRLCSLTQDEEELESYYLRAAIRDWPLGTGETTFPIYVENVGEPASIQYEVVSMSYYTGCATDYKAEYIGLRWHLLHHCIMYVEDIIYQLEREQQP